MMIYKNERNFHRHTKLIELCLSTNCFIFDNRVHILKYKAMQEALATNLAPLTYR